MIFDEDARSVRCPHTTPKMRGNSIMYVEAILIVK